MRKGLALEKLAALTIVMIMTAVGLQIISGLREDASETDLRLEELYTETGYPYCAEFGPGQEISKEEFYKITYYRLRNSCNLSEQDLTSDFTLRKDQLEEKAREWGLQDSNGDLMVFYRETCSSAGHLELTGLTVGQDAEFLFRPGDSLSFSGTGEEVVIC
jgi:hypothetical protein